MNRGNSRAGWIPIGVCNRDIVDASPLKYHILVHIQLLNNGRCDFARRVSALNDLTHVDDMRRIGEHEGVPVGENLEIVIIRQLSVSHLERIYIIEIFIMEIPGKLLIHPWYCRSVFE